MEEKKSVCSFPSCCLFCNENHTKFENIYFCNIKNLFKTNLLHTLWEYELLGVRAKLSFISLPQEN